MVQTTNRFFDEMARLMNDAAGAAQGMRREVETLFRRITLRKATARTTGALQKTSFSDPLGSG